MPGHPLSTALVSCLCVTHDRVPMLRRAIGCFMAQTHPARELVVLHEDGDTATRDFLAALANPKIRTVQVPSTPRLPIGVKRNLLVDAVKGDYVANWDDDDWSAPDRLSKQLRTIDESGLPASVLKFEVVYDAVNARAFLSQDRNWENSIVCRRSDMPRYGNTQIGEDVPCIEQLMVRKHLASLASPHLYIYVFHGSNTCSAMHFSANIFTRGVQLDAATAARVAAVLENPDSPPLTLEEVLAGRG